MSFYVYIFCTYIRIIIIEIQIHNTLTYIQLIHSYIICHNKAGKDLNKMWTTICNCIEVIYTQTVVQDWNNIPGMESTRLFLSNLEVRP